MSTSAADKPAILVVAAALFDSHGRCLVQQRPPGKAHAGLWEFPGGKVDPGETPPAALVRELREELAIVVAPPALTAFGFATDITPDGRSLVMLLYRCHAWTGRPQALAASALRWDVPGALAGLPMPPVDVPLLAALAATGALA